MSSWYIADPLGWDDSCCRYDSPLSEEKEYFNKIYDGDFHAIKKVYLDNDTILVLLVLRDPAYDAYSYHVVSTSELGLKDDARYLTSEEVFRRSGSYANMLRAMFAATRDAKRYLKPYQKEWLDLDIQILGQALNIFPSEET